MGLTNNLGKLSNMITSTGSAVGIGTASPSKLLHLYNTAGTDVMLVESTQVFSTIAFKSSTNSSTVTIGIDGAGNAAIENKLTTGAMAFVTNGNERLRITAAGNVGIGTSTPTFKLQVATGVSGNLCNFSDGVAQTLVIKTDASSLFLDASNGGNMIFQQAATERMRLNGGGYLKVDPNGTYVLPNTNFHELWNRQTGTDLIYMRHTTADPYGIEVVFSGASPNNTSNFWFLAQDTTNAKAIIYSNGTFGSRTGTYGSIISDEKYKQDILDASSQWEDIKNLRVVNFKFKQDVELEGEKALRQIGFIAQEVEKVSPNLVYESKDRDSGETWKSVKTSIIEIKAIKALQEAMAKIEKLEERLNKAGL